MVKRVKTLNNNRTDNKNRLPKHGKSKNNEEYFNQKIAVYTQESALNKETGCS